MIISAHTSNKLINTAGHDHAHKHTNNHTIKQAINQAHKHITNAKAQSLLENTNSSNKHVNTQTITTQTH